MLSDAPQIGRWRRRAANVQSGGLCKVAGARVRRREWRPHISRIERSRRAFHAAGAGALGAMLLAVNGHNWPLWKNRQIVTQRFQSLKPVSPQSLLFLYRSCSRFLRSQPHFGTALHVVPTMAGHRLVRWPAARLYNTDKATSSEAVFRSNCALDVATSNSLECPRECRSDCADEVGFVQSGRLA